MDNKSRPKRISNKRFYQTRRILIFVLLLILCDTNQLRLYARNNDLIVFRNNVDSIYYLADSILETMSLKEMIAQSIMINVSPSSSPSQLAYWTDYIKKNKFGGVLFGKGSVEDQLVMTNISKKVLDIPLLVGFDGEWGLSMRLKKTTRYPYNILLGAVNDTELLKQYGAMVAEECKRLGIHIMFAPVLDVNNNPNNPVIGYRSYGESPNKVTMLGLAYSEGLEENGILSCAKHFPGHGNTAVDSHKALPKIEGSKQSLLETELIPFKNYILKGLGSIMVGHLQVPSLSNNPQPASINKDIICNLLIQEMGFNGLVITDALAMKGVLGNKAINPSVEAYKAGADILLGSLNPVKDIDDLANAVNSGEISYEIVTKKCRKILAFKLALNVFDKTPIKKANIEEDLNSEKAKKLSTLLYERGMTLIKNEKHLLPISSHNRNLHIIHWGSNVNSSAIKNGFKDLNRKISYHHLNSKANREHIINLLKKIPLNDLVLIWSDKTKPDNSAMEAIFKQRQCVLILMAMPYCLENYNESIINNAYSIAIGYENNFQATLAMSKAISGKVPFQGHLPVSIGNYFQVGEGICSADPILKTVDPESVGLLPNKLNEIDDIAKEGIKKGAYPGCQILVAKDGHIVYNKAFGYKDSSKKEANDIYTLYDLASVTKATATIGMLMKAYEDRLLNLEDPIEKYLDYLIGTDKDNIKIVDLCTHTAGLPSIIRFYEKLINPDSYVPPLISFKPKAGYPIKIANRAYARDHFRFNSDIVSNDSSSLFPVRFAKGLFLSPIIRDSIIRQEISKSTLLTKTYRYSDIDFLLLQDIIEKIYHESLDSLFEHYFTVPLKLKRILYRPYLTYDSFDIAEGQHDYFLRKQTLRGDVDDESAAMLGGVSGNAGLFSNAVDLAVLLQLFLNGGSLNGVKLLNTETVKLFTQYNTPKSPYALGFDKPRGEGKRRNTSRRCSKQTYGHTGFTGTCFWVDPENSIIFIFLSNRGAPTRWNPKLSQLNIRPRIHDAIYRALR